jgi:hypothetical protein
MKPSDAKNRSLARSLAIAGMLAMSCIGNVVVTTKLHAQAKSVSTDAIQRTAPAFPEVKETPDYSDATWTPRPMRRLN